MFRLTSFRYVSVVLIILNKHCYRQNEIELHVNNHINNMSSTQPYSPKQAFNCSLYPDISTNKWIDTSKLIDTTRTSCGESLKCIDTDWRANCFTPHKNCSSYSARIE